MKDASPRHYLVTYAPLVRTATGRAAASKYDLPPFIDGSIRREPDLEHQRPAITCLCRADKFAPRLREGDIVAYMTAKGCYGLTFRHWRLTAVLKVQVCLPSHAEAAAWYHARRLPLPNNLMVRGNPPKPMDQSHESFDAEPASRANGSSCSDPHQAAWDAVYWSRAKAFGTVVACRRLFRNLTWDAPIIREDDLLASFAYLPGTRNPGALHASGFAKLFSRLKIKVRVDSPSSVRRL
jgi:hypothetical protein